MSSSRNQAAEFETTSRLVACLVNEGLVNATVVDSTKSDITTWIELHDSKNTQAHAARLGIKVAASSHAKLAGIRKPPGLFLQPDDLIPPVIFEYRSDGSALGGSKELLTCHPSELFDVIANWFLDQGLMESAVQKQITEELTNSAQNQGVPYPSFSDDDPLNSIRLEEWLRVASEESAPELTDPSIKWERAIIRGHPTHPVSALFLLQVAFRCLVSAMQKCNVSREHLQRSNHLS